MWVQSPCSTAAAECSQPVYGAVLPLTVNAWRWSLSTGPHSYKGPEAENGNQQKPATARAEGIQKTLVSQNCSAANTKRQQKQWYVKNCMSDIQCSWQWKLTANHQRRANIIPHCCISPAPPHSNTSYFNAKHLAVFVTGTSILSCWKDTNFLPWSWGLKCPKTHYSVVHKWRKESLHLLRRRFHVPGLKASLRVIITKSNSQNNTFAGRRCTWK